MLRTRDFREHTFHVLVEMSNPIHGVEIVLSLLFHGWGNSIALAIPSAHPVEALLQDFFVGVRSSQPSHELT